jgi:hypothetical protein
VQADPDASGWDSDDDAKRSVPPPQHHQFATGGQQGEETSGWDDSDDETLRPGKKAHAGRAPVQSRGTCGAPIRTTEAFVDAKPKAAAVSSTKPGNDLDDLMGEIMTADADVSRGGASHGLVPGFQCTACDFQVLRIDNMIWRDDVEYMFFRNNYPNVQKLRPRLVAQKGCVAYCCQCSWKSANSAAELVDVAEGLRWRCVGY